MVVSGGEVVGDGFGGGGGEEDGAVFVAFAADDEFAAFEVDLAAVEGDEFGDAEAGGKEELEDGLVAEVVGGDFV